MSTRNRINPTAKILTFDIETADLNANRGHIICAAAKWVGKREVYTWRIDETPGYGTPPKSFITDSLILKGLIPLLEEAEAVVGQYISRFDAPYVTTRAIINKLKPPAPYTIIDTWSAARSYLKLARNDLGSITATMDCKHQKTHLDWSAWEVARYGDKKAIDLMLKYNVNDVRATEDAYLALRPIMRHHPYVGVADAGVHRCPACGSGKYKKNGVRRLKAYEVARAQCKECGTDYEIGRRKIR